MFFGEGIMFQEFQACFYTSLITEVMCPVTFNAVNVLVFGLGYFHRSENVKVKVKSKKLIN
jgi:hypothetical protein